MDQERVRAGRGGVRARGPGGLLRGEGVARLRRLLRALRRVDQHTGGCCASRRGGSAHCRSNRGDLGRDDIGALAPGKCGDFFAINLDRLAYAGASFYADVTRRYVKPEWGIPTVSIEGQEVRFRSPKLVIGVGVKNDFPLARRCKPAIDGQMIYQRKRGRQWDVLLRGLDETALEQLRFAEGIVAIESRTPSLEEIFVAYMTGAPQTPARKPEDVSLDLTRQANPPIRTQGR